MPSASAYWSLDREYVRCPAHDLQHAGGLVFAKTCGRRTLKAGIRTGTDGGAQGCIHLRNPSHRRGTQAASPAGDR